MKVMSTNIWNSRLHFIMWLQQGRNWHFGTTELAFSIDIEKYR